jgi:hypothetical protein
MLQQTKILIILIVAAVSIGIIPPRDNAEALYVDIEAGVFREPGSEEIGTRDQIVFDENVWKTNCSDVYEHLSDAAGTGGGSAQYTFDINACSAYERDRAAQYGDLGQAPSRGRQKRKMFLHVSKSGGSFFCACGYHNHENQDLDSSFRINCHYLREDSPWWGNSARIPGYASRTKVHSDSCNTYEHALADKHVTLEGNENHLPRESELCDNLENILIIRDPIHRLASHVHEIEKHFYESTRNASEMSLSQINADYPWLADNYLTRSLSGKSVFQAEFGTVTEAAFLNAKQVIHKFDNIFVMAEDLVTELEHHYGWSCGDVPGRANHETGGTAAIVKHWKETWPSNDWQRLLGQHRFDSNLFEEAQRVSFLKSFKRYRERSNIGG